MPADSVVATLKTRGKTRRERVIGALCFGVANREVNGPNREINRAEQGMAVTVAFARLFSLSMMRF